MRQTIFWFDKKMSWINPVITLVAIFFALPNHGFCQVISYQRTNFGVSCRLASGAMNLYLIDEDVAEVKFSTQPMMPAKQSLVVDLAPSYLKIFSVAQSKTEIVITTKRLSIHIDRQHQAIRYFDRSGLLILAEASLNGKTMSDTTIAGTATKKCSASFESPVDEGLFGLGCHPLDSGSINYKGRNQEMAIKYLTGAIPVLMSTSGYGLLFDNYSQSAFFGAERNNTQYSYASESGTMVDYYFFYGPSFDRIVDGYRTLTGKAPMYPRWAFGLFQSQDRYKKQEEVLAAADGYRSRHIPVDAIVQDWYYWYPLPIGSHVMLPSAYPDPKAMVDSLHATHFHGMISIWPCFGNGTGNFDALKNAGDLTDITWDNFTTHTRDTYYDAHSPKARELYWQQARDSLVKRFGWDGWWVDQCEPDTEDPNDRKKSKFFSGAGIDYFNSYSLEHTKGIYEKWRRDIPGKRIYLLARQAFAGQQRYGATLWSSDISCSFHDFRDQIPQAINTGASGYPYWTSDIGGYISRTVSTGIPDWTKPENRELFVRWFQFGTFSPIFRIHGRGERALFSNNWDENTRQILLKYDNLRYRLLPYIYSLSAQVTNSNYTMMRSLVFDFRKDSAVYAIPDQYMFGPAFLVNPVTAQLYTAAGADQLAKTRKLYLPKGKDWVDFWTGEKIPGGQSIDAVAPMETLPLYVPSGTVLPMGKLMEFATEKSEDSIELRIYTGANGRFTLYEDANDSYDYEKGQSANIDLSWNDHAHELTIAARKGVFPGMLRKRVFNVVLVDANKGTGVGPTAKPDSVIHYSGTAVKVKL